MADSPPGAPTIAREAGAVPAEMGSRDARSLIAAPVRGAGSCSPAMGTNDWGDPKAAPEFPRNVLDDYPVGRS
jgi:hypothetical protein